ncbi:MAG: polysaccharide biosynthesis protein [Actinobacteria bacterium]|nr:polysaccharide biosynthesis protein [Actinomycetota bacterium]
MDRVGRMSKNAAALIGAKVVTSVLTFFMLLVINRNLGPEKAGIYAYALVLYTLFQVIPDFGIGNISIRDISQDHGKIHTYFTNIVMMRLLMGIGAFSLLIITNTVSISLQGWNSVGWEKFWVVLTIGVCLMLEQPISNTLAECFIALEKLTTVALVYLVMAVLKVSLSLYVIFMGRGNELVLLMAVYILTIVYSICNFYYLYRRALKRDILGAADKEDAEDLVIAETLTHRPELSGETAVPADVSFASIAKAEQPDLDAGMKAYREAVRFRIDKELWKYLLKSAWPLAVASAGVTVYAGVDIPILSWFKGDQEVGLYSAAAMFAKAAVFLTLAINIALLPAISSVGGKYPERLGEIWERIMGYILIIIVPIAVIIPVLARPILIIQEHNFVSALHAVWLTMAAMNFTFLSSVCFPVFIVLDKQKKMTAIVVAGIGIKLAMNIIAIPLWGYTGAAVVMLISECAVFGILFRVLSKELDYAEASLKFTIKPFVSLALMYTVVFLMEFWLIRGNSAAMKAGGALVYGLIIAAVAGIIYIVSILLTGQLSRKGLNELNDLLKVE